ncbi:hypothetical protein QN277_009716 [Acacia crassicarpa]|uniref:Uncharacterized protein n=1 Tax=Acacia crassicarpa TaxID=499986 RepID=A0AAE1INN3_9FABA|nr:hypothetical protein QN277_009716 [Acacia crassicarpa]
MGSPLELEADLANWVDEKNIHVSSFSGQKVQQLETNYNDNAFEKEALPIEKTTLSRGNEDVEVNITGCTKSSEPLIREDTCDDDDATECSSSFGDTGSGTDNASAFSDDEVTSYMYAKDPFSPMFYGDSKPGLIRREKLTSHWESFIRPLSWCCKWLELKLKQLQSQEHKYEKELAAYEYRRQFVTENFSLDGCNTKSIPLPVGLCGKKVIKRKKCKRIEETCNLASYTSDHCVLSYFEKKDRAADARLKNANSFLKNVNGVAKAAKNPQINEELFKWNDDIFSHLENDLSSSLELNDTDRALVKMFERIEAAKFEVHKLRTRIDKAVYENVVKSSSVKYLNKQGLVPSNGLDPYNPNSASASRIKDTFSARNQFMRKTKESVEEHKSVSQAQASAPDLFAKNVVPNLLSYNLKDCSPSKSNVCGNKRKKSGSN